MNKTLTIIIACLLLLVMGFSLIFTAVLMMPEQFDELYLGELADKYARLRSLSDENKIIVVGGSSVAFGINSQVMEKYLGLPVVNFGLYGPLGTTIMMDLTRGHIREGDIIVLAPETDEQTMSMTFNGEGFWESCDSDFTMLLKVRFHNWDDMLGSFWVYALKKLQFFRLGKAQPDGVYDHDSFDEYGDVIYERTGTIMADGYDPTVPIDLTASVVEQEWLDYVNDYIDYCESRGATVYYSWPPMNELGIVQEDEAEILEFATFIRENIHCTMISDISDYILDAGYFYDTNYHVNDVGVYVHTANLIQDLENVIGDGDYIPIERPAPPEWIQSPAGPNGMPMPVGRWQGDQAPPAAAATVPTGTNTPPAGWLDPQGNVPGANPNVSLPTASDTETAEETAEETAAEEPVVEEAVGSSKDAACFTYEAYDEGLLITGVQGDGLTAATLEIPWLIDGQKVIAIGANAFADAENLTTLYIQSNITRIMQDAFDSCATLSAIHIDNENGGSILIPGIDLFTDVPKRCKVYIAQANYGSFIADYFWANYLDRLAVE